MNFISSFTALSSDVLILLGACALLFFLILKLGASRIVSFAFSLYIALAVYSHALFISSLSVLSGSPVKDVVNSLALFLIILIPAYIVLERIIVADIGYGAKRFIKAILISVACVGLVTSIFYHVIPVESLYDFSPFVDRLFESDTAFSIWLLVPLAVLFF